MPHPGRHRWWRISSHWAMKGESHLSSHKSKLLERFERLILCSPASLTSSSMNYPPCSTSSLQVRLPTTKPLAWTQFHTIRARSPTISQDTPRRWRSTTLYLRTSILFSSQNRWRVFDLPLYSCPACTKYLDSQRCICRLVWARRICCLWGLRALDSAGQVRVRVLLQYAWCGIGSGDGWDSSRNTARMRDLAGRSMQWCLCSTGNKACLLYLYSHTPGRQRQPAAYVNAVHRDLHYHASSWLRHRSNSGEMQCCMHCTSLLLGCSSCGYLWICVRYWRASPMPLLRNPVFCV